LGVNPKYSLSLSLSLALFLLHRNMKTFIWMDFSIQFNSCLLALALWYFCNNQQQNIKHSLWQTDKARKFNTLFAKLCCCVDFAWIWWCAFNSLSFVSLAYLRQLFYHEFHEFRFQIVMLCGKCSNKQKQKPKICTFHSFGGEWIFQKASFSIEL